MIERRGLMGSVAATGGADRAALVPWASPLATSASFWVINACNDDFSEVSCWVVVTLAGWAWRRAISALRVLMVCPSCACSWAVRFAALLCSCARKASATCWASRCAAPGDGPVAWSCTSDELGSALAVSRPCRAAVLSLPPSTWARIVFSSPGETSSVA